MLGLNGLLWLQDQNRLYNGWLEESPNEYYLEGAMNEIEEIRETLLTNDHDELELEVGDLLWDVLSLINKLDKQGLIDRNRVCPRAVAKFAERMPYNVEGYFEGNSDKRHETWEAAKKLQKMRGVDEEHPLTLKVWNSVQKAQSKKHK